MSTAVAKDYAYVCKQVSIGATAVGVATAYFSCGTSVLFAGCTVGYFSLLGNSVTNANSGNKW